MNKGRKLVNIICILGALTVILFTVTACANKKDDNSGRDNNAPDASFATSTEWNSAIQTTLNVVRGANSTYSFKYEERASGVEISQFTEYWFAKGIVSVKEYSTGTTDAFPSYYDGSFLSYSPNGKSDGEFNSIFLKDIAGDDYPGGRTVYYDGITDDTEVNPVKTTLSDTRDLLEFAIDGLTDAFDLFVYKENENGRFYEFVRKSGFNDNDNALTKKFTPVQRFFVKFTGQEKAEQEKVAEIRIYKADGAYFKFNFAYSNFTDISLPTESNPPTLADAALMLVSGIDAAANKINEAVSENEAIHVEGSFFVNYSESGYRITVNATLDDAYTETANSYEYDKEKLKNNSAMLILSINNNVYGDYLNRQWHDLLGIYIKDGILYLGLNLVPTSSNLQWYKFSQFGYDYNTFINPGIDNEKLNLLTEYIAKVPLKIAAKLAGYDDPDSPFLSSIEMTGGLSLTDYINALQESNGITSDFFNITTHGHVKKDLTVSVEALLPRIFKATTVINNLFGLNMLESMFEQMGLSFLLNNISQTIFNHSFTDIKTGNIEPGYLPTLRFGGTLTDGIIHSAYLQFINENNSLVCEVGVSDVSVTVGAKTVPAPATLNLNNIEETVFRFSDRFAVPDKGLTLRTDIYIHPNAAVIIPPRSSDIQITFEDMRLYGTITIETYQQMNKLGTIFFKYETDPSEPNPNLRKKLYIDMRQLGRNTDNNGNYIFNSGAFDIDRGGVYVMPLDLETLINSKIPFGSISGFLQNAEGYGMVADIVYEAILQYIAFPPKTSDGFNDVLMTLLYGLYDEYGLVNIAELMEETSAAVTNGQTISVSFGRLITLLNEQFGRVVVGGNDYKSDNFGALADSLYKDPLQFFAEYIYSYRNGGTLPSDPTEEYTKLMLIADLYTYFGVDLSEAKMVSLYGTGKDIDQMRRDYIFKLRIDISASIWVLGNFDGPGAVVRAYFDLNDNGILDDGEFIVYGNEFTIELYDRNEYLGNIAYSSARDNDYSSAVSVVDPLTGDISGLILLQLDIQRAITAFAEIPSQG